MGPAPLRMTPRRSWDHGYILEKGFHTLSWCQFFLAYIILQQNCFEFRAIFLRCKNWIPKWVTCLRIAGEPIWHHLASSAVYGTFFCLSVPFLLTRGQRQGLNVDVVQPTHLHSCAIHRHTSCPLGAVAGNQRQEVCLCLDLTGSKSFYSMSLRFL